MSVSLARPEEDIWAKHLVAGEQVLFRGAQSRFATAVSLALAAMLFSATTWWYHATFFEAGSITEVCGPTRFDSCWRAYILSRILLPLSAGLTLVAYGLLVATLLGWNKVIFAVTNKRLLKIQTGFFPRPVWLKLDGAHVRQSAFGGITVKSQGGKLRLYGLGTGPARSAEEAAWQAGAH